MSSRRRFGFLQSVILGLVLASVVIWCRFGNFQRIGESFQPDVSGLNNWCPVPDVVTPLKDLLLSSGHFDEPGVLETQIQRLSAAVQVPTESFDDNGEVDEDPRWTTIDDFHKILEELFPLIYSQYKPTKVNRYGLLYTFNGTDVTKKPLLLTAHQDVVPAGPTSGWTYPPFSPHFDGIFLWGRGSTDCKNVLIGILSALEDLTSQDFLPKRTVVLAFGFDEETGGYRGAAKLAQALLAEWGSDSFEFLLDEGGMGVQEVGDVLYALPGVAEKGYHDIELTLQTTGGHSSKPPFHTGIGIMADMVVALEKHPYVPRLTQSNPFRRVLECRATYSPREVEPWLKKALRNGDEEELAARLVEGAHEERWLMQTSQAVDVFAGGVKVNALPEKVMVLINHRIAPHDSIEVVNQHVHNVLKPIAANYGIQIMEPSAIASNTQNATSTGTLAFSFPQSLDVAPVSPTNNRVWSVFAGTLRSVFQHPSSASQETLDRPRRVIPVGDIMTGNTDTQHYWNLTKNIYRFTPAREGSRVNTHGADERMRMDAHIEGIKVYYDLIRNFDVWNGE
ncbi:peptidase family M20/M25/M40 [Melanomma pulvis-pyrius CBS 109.77]|uniref:Peptidase family M20/M25/M40 n=1 Tax=Melanomma pulvis-pyrius CBS 109.77 TaxID=1314802 RepID=A0A6A6WUG9_9PLEO|nr:peptidase family M20/M25/M40 [Melanomma pulvis-pyrius CBS 109.77]